MQSRGIKSETVIWSRVMNPENIRKLIKKGRILWNEPMSRHTSFRVGGPARVFLEPFTEEELTAAILYFRRNGIPYIVTGNGTNLLVSDEGYDGAVIHLGRVEGSDFVMLGYEETEEGVLFDAGCGCLMSSLGSIAASLSCTGFEPLSGIPGCIGGAVAMNAGAYGTETGKLLKDVSFVTEKGEKKTLEKKDLVFRYRGSSLADRNAVITRVSYYLPKGETSEISARMKEYAERRKEKQPLEYPSAGSTFKRPEGYYAGKLIEDCGLKGYAVGGACVSEKHAGFIINRDHASAEDIYRLIRKVRQTVLEKYRISLETEVKMIGEFKDEQ